LVIYWRARVRELPFREVFVGEPERAREPAFVGDGGSFADRSSFARETESVRS